MKRKSAVLVTFLLMVIPSQLFAKGATVRITIKGADLRTPIEITEAKVLAHFQVWTGPGTSSNEAKSFIIDWSQGPAAERPKGLQRYEVSFYAKLPSERLIYVVFYEYDPTTDRGYVYLPGRTDDWYALNVGTIDHGVEGNWFHAWTVWDRVAGPLIASAKATASSTGPGKSPR
jgi:hypothetical protein